ncbi:hypothetical protein ANANG_G00261420 [Anguilla anguilla]|uniref:Uncharacterized protein n=1 Tax=Anguilla anguilla TaxID=7936 RepID=A0A9D3LSP4_ANGAN|nr:hypothetical protein ANANG_G00261420 [Anguilla anguilla]
MMNANTPRYSEAKRHVDRRRLITRVNLGIVCLGWHQLMFAKGMKSDVELACVLFDLKGCWVTHQELL